MYLSTNIQCILVDACQKIIIFKLPIYQLPLILQYQINHFLLGYLNFKLTLYHNYSVANY